MVNNIDYMGNPFLPRKADNLKSKQVIGFFANHTKCAPIQERGHHLIIGASGTGKTIAFRYFSLKDQLKGGNIISTPHTFIGIYVSLKTDLEIWRRKEITNDLVFFYENYLNIAIGYEIISLLQECSSKNLWETDWNSEKNLELTKDILGLNRSITTFKNIESILNEEKRKIVKYVNTTDLPKKGDFKSTFTTSIITFIPSLCRGIVENLTILRENDIPFYLFLDYYDELQPWQQSIVNTLIQRPSEGYFVKLGSRPFGIYEYNTMTNKSIIDALDGRIYLQYFRDELEDFKKVLVETVARRLGWSLPPDTSLIDKFFPAESPLNIAEKLDEIVSIGRISDQLEQMATSGEEKKKLKSCIYQGFGKLAEIAEGNIGIFMELCADAWEKARLKGLKLDTVIPQIPPICQTNAVWNFSQFQYSDIEVCSSDGPYILNLIDKICETLHKQTPLSRNRNYESWNIEINADDKLSAESIERLKRAFQYRVFVPTSIGGYLDIPEKFNLCSFYLLTKGLVELEYPPLILNSQDVDNWLAHLSETITKPSIKTSKSPLPSKHTGFLSISFREEEPAKTVREKVLKLFKAAPFEIECVDAEKFGYIGSPKLLERIRGFISKKSTFCLVEVSNITPNTMVELGLIKGQNRRFWAVAHIDKFSKLPDWIGGLQLHRYSLDDADKERYLDIVVENHIISPLQSITRKQFCPLWHGLLRYCPYPVTKDPSTIYISYPDGDDIWNIAIKELKDVCKSLNIKLITDKDIKIYLSGTPDMVCIWCVAVRSAGKIFVDTTPQIPMEETDKEKKEGDPTKCFILGLAFGQRERKGTLCVHLFKGNLGKKITLWKGYPEYQWNTKNELVNIIKEIIEKLGENDESNA
jgi:hypothetical protein